MPTSAEWGLGWAVAAYAVSWAVLIGYTRYVNARSKTAYEALQRESQRTEVRS